MSETYKRVKVRQMQVHLTAVEPSNKRADQIKGILIGKEKRNWKGWKERMEEMAGRW